MLCRRRAMMNRKGMYTFNAILFPNVSAYPIEMLMSSRYCKSCYLVYMRMWINPILWSWLEHDAIAFPRPNGPMKISLTTLAVKAAGKTSLYNTKTIRERNERQPTYMFSSRRESKGSRSLEEAYGGPLPWIGFMGIDADDQEYNFFSFLISACRLWFPFGVKPALSPVNFFRKPPGDARNRDERGGSHHLAVVHLPVHAATEEPATLRRTLQNVSDDPSLVEFRRQLVHESARVLDSCRMIRWDDPMIRWDDPRFGEMTPSRTFRTTRVSWNSEDSSCTSLHACWIVVAWFGEMTPNDSVRWPHDSVRWTHDSVRWTHDSVRWTHDSVRWTHDSVRWTHDSVRWTHDSVRWTHDSVRWPHDSVRWPHDSARWPQEPAALRTHHPERLRRPESRGIPQTAGARVCTGVG